MKILSMGLKMSILWFHRLYLGEKFSCKDIYVNPKNVCSSNFIPIWNVRLLCNCEPIEKITHIHVNLWGHKVLNIKPWLVTSCL